MKAAGTTEKGNPRVSVTGKQEAWGGSRRPGEEPGRMKKPGLMSSSKHEAGR